MNDGRNYAEWRPEAVINATIREKHNIKTNWNYRKYLQNNSDEIIQSNQYLACDECGRCPYYNTGKIQNIPYLFRNMVDEIKPFGYETSDQKELYLSRQIFKPDYLYLMLIKVYYYHLNGLNNIK